MLTPREKSPLPKMSPEEDRTRDAVDSEPKHYQLSYSGPPIAIMISVLDLDLDQYVANHPFTGIGATEAGAQFAGTIGFWLLPEPILNCQLTFDVRWYRPGGSTQLLSLGSINGGIGQCVIWSVCDSV